MLGFRTRPKPTPGPDVWRPPRWPLVVLVVLVAAVLVLLELLTR